LAWLEHADIAPDASVGALSPGARQLVEIARALAHRARIVVMDEPTSSLGLDDQQRLFAAVRRLAASGVGVVYISHFLDEVKQVADRFTVLRDGRSVGSGDVARTPTEAIIERMAGRRLEQLYPRVPRAIGDVALRVAGLAGERLPRAVDLEVRAGQILGIAGLGGAGRTELLRCIFGLDAVRAGTIAIGAARDGGAPPARRLAQGCALVSEDRKGEGLALRLSIAVNVTLSHLAPLCRAGWIDLRAQAACTRRWLERLGVRARGPAQPVGELSGGNQQRVAFARLLHQDARILLLDEPTRGIDVASKSAIYQLIGELAAAGKAIVLVSSYLPELLGVCDRIAVMHRGVLGRARPASDWTEQAILTEATGGAA
jgi:ribose transport system ATP-binding protein